MPHSGLYEQVINKSLNRQLAKENDKLFDTVKIDNAEAPSILSKYISEVVEKGLPDDKTMHKKSGATARNVILLKHRQEE